MIQHQEEIVIMAALFFNTTFAYPFIMALTTYQEIAGKIVKSGNRKEANISSLGALRKPPSKAVMSLDCVRSSRIPAGRK